VYYLCVAAARPPALRERSAHSLALGRPRCSSAARAAGAAGGRRQRACAPLPSRPLPASQGHATVLCFPLLSTVRQAPAGGEASVRACCSRVGKCEQGRKESKCKDCGTGYCEHGRQEARCKDCGTGRCKHGREKGKCKAGLRHGLLRARVPEGPVQGLRHGLLRARAPDDPVQGLRHEPLRARARNVRVGRTCAVVLTVDGNVASSPRFQTNWIEQTG
jgi:hypothetical protein